MGAEKRDAEAEAIAGYTEGLEARSVVDDALNKRDGYEDYGDSYEDSYEDSYGDDYDD